MQSKAKSIAKTLIIKVGTKLPPIGRVFEERDNLRAHLDAIQKQQTKPQRPPKKHQVQVAVEKDDLLAVNARSLREYRNVGIRNTKKTLTINWVVPAPLSHEGGGYATIMSIITYLESKGHTCRIYNYDPFHLTNLRAVQDIAAYVFPNVKAQQLYGATNMKECDAIFATSWETAYPVFRFSNFAKKFYLVQDYEPYFHPIGTTSNLAEQTYNMGFYGITAGKWLQKKVAEHSMPADYFDFSADGNMYFHKNFATRNKVLFYFQPGKSRRGFELGVYALELFNKTHPKYQILLLGTDDMQFRLPFKYKNLGALHKSKLNVVYNQCAAALVIGFTNMSLLPLEVMAAGCIPVVNDGENNRLVSNNPNIVYTPPFPEDLSDALFEVISQEDLPNIAKKASDSVRQTVWSTSYEKIHQIILREVSK
jgi:hypothetical protein